MHGGMPSGYRARGRVGYADIRCATSGRSASMPSRPTTTCASTSRPIYLPLREELCPALPCPALPCAIYLPCAWHLRTEPAALRSTVALRRLRSVATSRPFVNRRAMPSRCTATSPNPPARDPCTKRKGEGGKGGRGTLLCACVRSGGGRGWWAAVPPWQTSAQARGPLVLISWISVLRRRVGAKPSFRSSVATQVPRRRLGDAVPRGGVGLGRDVRVQLRRLVLPLRLRLLGSVGPPRPAPPHEPPRDPALPCRYAHKPLQAGGRAGPGGNLGLAAASAQHAPKALWYQSVLRRIGVSSHTAIGTRARTHRQVPRRRLCAADRVRPVFAKALRDRRVLPAILGPVPLARR